MTQLGRKERRLAKGYGAGTRLTAELRLRELVRRINAPYLLGHWKKRTAALKEMRALQKEVA